MCLCHVRGKGCGRDKKCVCGRYADANPRETRIVTKKGYDLHWDWGLEQFQRDQESFRMHIFSDWTGYGTCEVMENMVRTIPGTTQSWRGLLIWIVSGFQQGGQEKDQRRVGPLGTRGRNGAVPQ